MAAGINPHVEESLNHGDIVALGKLKIQVLAAEYLTRDFTERIMMAYSVILHIAGEPSIAGEVEELPKPADTLIIGQQPAVAGWQGYSLSRA